MEFALIFYGFYIWNATTSANRVCENESSRNIHFEPDKKIIYGLFFWWNHRCFSHENEKLMRCGILFAASTLWIIFSMNHSPSHDKIIERIVLGWAGSSWPIEIRAVKSGWIEKLVITFSTRMWIQLVSGVFCYPLRSVPELSLALAHLNKQKLAW